MSSSHSPTTVLVSSGEGKGAAPQPLRHTKPYNEPYGDGHYGWQSTLGPEKLLVEFEVFCHTIQGLLNNSCEVTREAADLDIVISQMITTFNFNCKSAYIVEWSGTRFRRIEQSSSGDMVEGQRSVRFEVARLVEYKERGDQGSPKEPHVIFDVGSHIVQVSKSELERAEKRIGESQPKRSGDIADDSSDSSPSALSKRSGGDHPNDSHPPLSSSLSFEQSGRSKKDYGTVSSSFLDYGMMQYLPQRLPSEDGFDSGSGKSSNDNKSLLSKAWSNIASSSLLSCVIMTNKEKGGDERDERDERDEEKRSLFAGSVTDPLRMNEKTVDGY